MPSSASCSTESDSSCCPTACSESSKKSVNDIFNVSHQELVAPAYEGCDTLYYIILVGPSSHCGLYAQDKEHPMCLFVGLRL